MILTNVSILDACYLLVRTVVICTCVALNSQWASVVFYSMDIVQLIESTIKRYTSDCGLVAINNTVRNIKTMVYE